MQLDSPSQKPLSNARYWFAELKKTGIDKSIAL